jgi:hypothetical protein
VTGPVGQRTSPVTVHEVSWADPAAVALRAAMAREMERRYADRLTEPGRRDMTTTVGVDAGRVAYTAVARTRPGRPGGPAVGTTVTSASRSARWTSSTAAWTGSR